MDPLIVELIEFDGMVSFINKQKIIFKYEQILNNGFKPLNDGVLKFVINTTNISRSLITFTQFKDELIHCKDNFSIILQDFEDETPFIDNGYEVEKIHILSVTKKYQLMFQTDGTYTMNSLMPSGSLLGSN